jgi:hypothetical protein
VKYDIRPAADGTLYEVVNIRGKVVSAHPMTRRAAIQTADLYEADDAEDVRQERVSADLD